MAWGVRPPRVGTHFGFCAVQQYRGCRVDMHGGGPRPNRPKCVPTRGGSRSGREPLRIGGVTAALSVSRCLDGRFGLRSYPPTHRPLARGSSGKPSVWIPLPSPLFGWGRSNLGGGEAIATIALTSFVMVQHPVRGVGVDAHVVHSTAQEIGCAPERARRLRAGVYMLYTNACMLCKKSGGAQPLCHRTEYFGGRCCLIIQGPRPQSCGEQEHHIWRPRRTG